MNFDGKTLEATFIAPDSYYVPNFLNALDIDADDMFKQLTQQVEWVDRNRSSIWYRGNTIKRTKGFYTENVDTNDGIPVSIFKYVYPGFNHRIMLEHSCFRDLPCLDDIVEKIKAGLTFQGQAIHLNHGIATMYQQPSDGIGAHHDKLESITPNTPILSLSFGCVREMHLTDDREHLQVIVMEPGSLFVLGPKTNIKMKHAIVPIDQEKVIQRTEGPGPRISIVLRSIAEQLSLQQVLEKVINNINTTSSSSDLRSRIAKLSKPYVVAEVQQIEHDYEQQRQQQKSNRDKERQAKRQKLDPVV